MKTTAPPLLVAAQPGPPPTRGIVMAYENMAAACQAAPLLCDRIGRTEHGPARRVSSWSFASLENPRCSAQAAADVRQAGWIVIAAESQARPLAAAIRRWLELGLAVRPGWRQRVTAVFGHDGHADSDGSLRFQAVRKLARAAGCDFDRLWGEAAENAGMKARGRLLLASGTPVGAQPLARSAQHRAVLPV